MAAAGLARFGRRLSNRLISPSFKESTKNANCAKTLSQSFFTKCPDYASTPVLMPALSPTMTEGTIVKWHKKEGDALNPGDLLCDIQTDKAVVSMDIEEEGILAKILKPDNSADIKIGTMIAVMVAEGEDWQSAEIPDTPTSKGSPKKSAATPKTTPEQPPVPQTTPEHTQMPSSIGPSVRKLLEEYHIPATKVTPSGPHGRILKGDILKFIKSNNLTKQDLKATTTPSPAPSPVEVPKTAEPPLQPVFIPGEEEEFVDIPLTGMRKTIAKRLTLSKTTIPHSYMSIDSNLQHVTKLRKKLVDSGIKVSMNDFIIKASALALQRVPKVNSVWQGEEAKMLSNVDISVAVATDQGLITPIVTNTAHLAVDEISNTVKELAVRAKQGKLQLHEFQGGSFTISNLGMFGISEFSAIINPPQTAIMAVGTSRLVSGDDGKPQTNMTVTLCYDSRVIDETDASKFLETFREYIESPNLMIVGSSLSLSEVSA